MKVTHGQMDSRIAALCKQLNLLHYHTHNSQRSNPGFPDWTFSGVYDPINDRSMTIFAEFKVGKDPLREDQAKWIRSLRKDGNFAWVVRNLDSLDLLDTILTTKCAERFTKTAIKLGELTVAEVNKVLGI